MHILIVTYYGLRESIKIVADNFNELGYKVSSFPFALYRHLKKSNICDDLIDMCNSKDKNKDYLGSKLVSEEKIDLLLYWDQYTFFTVEEHIKIRQNIKCLVFSWNWDPTYITGTEIEHWKRKRKETEDTEKYIDLKISCNPLEVNSIKGMLYCTPGCSLKIHYPIESNEHKCDVSIVCTNLYKGGIWDEKLQKISRKDLVDMIYKDKSINFHIYGLDNFKNLYPNSYKGYINYHQSNKVFHNSKINIGIQCFNIDKYNSERNPQVFASGGLLLIDNDLGNGLENNVHYVKIDIENPMKQIKFLLENDKLREKICKNALEISKNFTWDNLTNLIDEKFNKMNNKE